MSKALVQKFSASASRPWEFDLFFVFRHPRESRKYIVQTFTGCSCDVYERPTYSEAEGMTPLGKREVYAEFSKWWDGTDPSQRPAGTKAANIERLRSSL